MAKLSRKAIREGLDQVPMDTLLLGVTQAKETPLTPKQREFARLVALGETKTGAYRKAYNSKGKPTTQAVEAWNTATNPKVAQMIEAFKLANEVEKQQTPAQLRRLVITQLTQHALDESFPPAQRVKALELLGKVTEVGAFTERKETTITHQSGDLKAKLMEQLKTVIDITPNQLDCTQDDADSLLAELQGEANLVDGDGENLAEMDDTHRTPTTLIKRDGAEEYTHTIPHIQSVPNSIPHIQSVPESASHTQSHSESIACAESGVGLGAHPADMGDPPLMDGNGDGTGGIFIEKSAAE